MASKRKAWHTEVRHNPDDSFPYYGYSVHENGIAEIACKRKHASSARASTEDLTMMLNLNDPKCENYTGQPLTGRLVKRFPKNSNFITIRESMTITFRNLGRKGKSLKEAVDHYMKSIFDS